MAKASSKPASPDLSGKINVLLIGGGGREHALAWRLKQSPRLGRLYATDCKNPGIADLAEPYPSTINYPRKDFFEVCRFCQLKNVGLVVIGPEDPLAAGLADALAQPVMPGEPVPAVFGPVRAGAMLETDKAWCKQLLRGAAVPIAEGRAFNDAEGAIGYIESRVSARRAVEQYITQADQIRDQEERAKSLLEAIEKVAVSLTPVDRAPGVIALTLAIAEAQRDPTDRRALVEQLRRTNRTIGGAYVTELPNLPVIKASGLAKGKGVVVPKTLDEALVAIDRIMVRREFGDAGRTVVIEEKLSGQEVSVFALIDGRNIYTLESCQDHKRLKDGAVGPNTGGMGAVSPPHPSADVTEALITRIEREVLVPTLDALRREEVEFRGIVYAGIMLTPGGPKVLEYNARFGDPECQVLMRRMQGDVLDILLATATQTLHEVELSWDPRPAVCVVLAAGGYPDKPVAGAAISGLDEAAAVAGVQIFHAGTARSNKGEIVTAGGRVLNVTAIGETLDAARAAAYKAVDLIRFEGMQVRRDIGSGVVG